MGADFIVESYRQNVCCISLYFYQMLIPIIVSQAKTKVTPFHISEANHLMAIRKSYIPIILL